MLNFSMSKDYFRDPVSSRDEGHIDKLSNISLSQLVYLLLLCFSLRNHPTEWPELKCFDIYSYDCMLLLSTHHQYWQIKASK